MAAFCLLSYDLQSGFTSNDSLKSILDLQYRINQVLNDKYITGSKFGISIYSLTGKKSIYKKNASALLTPASNTKLFTSFAILDNFGKNFTINTSIYTDSDKISNGVLNGNIYLFGRGDIYLGIADLEELAQQLKNLGINKINGNVYADVSFFDEDYYRLSYSGDNEEVEATGPIYPLSIEKNLINVLVKSGSKPGTKANIQVIPYSNSYKIINNAQVAYAKKRRPARNISVKITNQGDNQVITISGTIAPNQTGYYSYYNTNPALTAAGVLKERLEVVGIKVSGAAAKGKFHQKKTNENELASFSRPVSDIMYWVNKKSDNYLAEILFKVLGAHYGKYPNTAQSAREIIMNTLTKHGINNSQFIINDGSGLSRRNLVSSDGLLSLLIRSLNRLSKTYLPISNYRPRICLCAK